MIFIFKVGLLEKLVEDLVFFLLELNFIYGQEQEFMINLFLKLELNLYFICMKKKNDLWMIILL